ncbi:hypothetical protein H4219_003271 [Mycoemilia scoparia]|uniref:Formamidopyrimidine-DNA glycosylase catalytic domain-containing protein n=1 Tax=Mycoemilia scoparia TaxID=417184 RepID=A0A9W8A107_9FUNG|nr:hypothetical protein H4219_003271 [Mycoemilia scoparia]
MPELAEVERARSLIHERCLGMIVKEAHADEDKILFAGTNHEEFMNRITSEKIVGTGRHGKYFYVHLSNNAPTILMHFGMTGDIKFKGEKDEPIRVERFDMGEAWPPKYTKFWLHLVGDDGAECTLAFTDPRRLGRVRLIDGDPETQPPLSQLGFDPILSPPKLSDFIKSVRKRQVPIKALLLDQKFSSGVGNWIADEVLFQSQVHPAQYSNTLDDEQLETILRNIIDICTQAVKCKADMRIFPKEWLFHYRWGKGKGIVCKLPDGRVITHETIGGRTTAIVADVQKLNNNAGNGIEKKKRPTKKCKISVESKISVVVKKEEDDYEIQTSTRRSSRVKKRVSYIE